MSSIGKQTLPLVNIYDFQTLQCSQLTFKEMCERTKNTEWRRAFCFLETKMTKAYQLKTVANESKEQWKQHESNSLEEEMAISSLKSFPVTSHFGLSGFHEEVRFCFFPPLGRLKNENTEFSGSPRVIGRSRTLAPFPHHSKHCVSRKPRPHKLWALDGEHWG